MKLKEAVRLAIEEGWREGFEPLADWLDRVLPRVSWGECGALVLQALGWSGLVLGGALFVAALLAAWGCP